MKFDLKSKKLLMIVALILIAVISFALLADLFADPENHKGSISYLDEKKETVMKLAGSATAASIALAAIPGDATTPAANTLSDMTKYLLIVLAAVVLEKYLVTLSGLAAFKVLIPLACLLYLLYLLVAKQKLRTIANKLLILALAVLLIVPVSVKVSSLIEATYETSVNAAIEYSDSLVQDANEEAEKESENNKESGGLSGFLSGVADSVGDIVGQVATTVSDLVEKAETSIGFFIESIAVMLITSCLIPLVVLILLVSIIKALFGSGPLTMADLANFDKMIRHKSKAKVTGEKAEQEQLTDGKANQTALPK